MVRIWTACLAAPARATHDNPARESILKPIPARDLLYHCAFGFVMGAALGIADAARQLSDSIVVPGGAILLGFTAMVYLEHVPKQMGRRAGIPPRRVNQTGQEVE